MNHSFTEWNGLFYILENKNRGFQGFPTYKNVKFGLIWDELNALKVVLFSLTKKDGLLRLV